MSTISINNNTKEEEGLLSLGFRIFFIGAGLFAVISIFMWMCIYSFGFQVIFKNISVMQWHAHEMIYGFSMAVVAGFLLTAVNNWTGVQTLFGYKLLMLFLCWFLSRIFMLFGTSFIVYAAVSDLIFMIFLMFALAVPIIKVKQWKQMGILSKVILLLVGNSLFYLGTFGYLDNGVYLGIYGGLYLIIGLIITMGRRVIPMFIENGVGYPVKLFNSKWIDISSLIFFLTFFIIEVFLDNKSLIGSVSIILFVITTIRLIGWHTVGIWKKSLLWSLYISFIFIDIGFLLFALSYFLGVSKLLAIHAFSVGGIGLVTLSMMSRVSLGHSGRSIHSPSKLLKYAFAFIILGTIIRVIFPLFEMEHYLVWIILSQLLWILSFIIFIIIYLPILSKASLKNN